MSRRAEFRCNVTDFSDALRVNSILMRHFQRQLAQAPQVELAGAQMGQILNVKKLVGARFPEGRVNEWK
jgi:hypothetical protein